jgi:SAM-dependent methyltransferase
MTVDLERMAAEQATSVSRNLLLIARRGGTEADFRREAARVLEDAGLAAGLTIVPRDEFSVARGRVDSVYNRLILEYKRPGVLRPSNLTAPNKAAIQQVKDYILDVCKRERREAHRLAGVATDGFHFIFVRRVGEGWSEPEVLPVSPASTERFLRLLFSLATGAALVPENLVEDFGPRTFRAQRAVRALYTALHSSKHPLVGKLFDQWRLFFSEATDYKEWAESIESKEEFRAFVKGMGLDPKYTEAPKVFFALHTYYALLIKLVASLAAARFAGGDSAPLSGLAAKQGDELREAFVDLERGGLFREYGIRNFLEGDFFGWYLPAWNDDIEDAVSKLVQRLAEYDPGTLELAPENARDLLKKLYHYLLPREIRHDLGEYYTPDWLAERLIIQTLGTADLGDATKRVLDPACGSGTFLVILIKYIRERAAKRKQDPSKTLELILQNVVGFDLNPLAVIAARTNYLLALGDLLKARKGDIDIPVYQADSVLAPTQGSDLYDGNVYPLKTSVGLFRVPAQFADRERMDVLANVLDEAVEARIGEDAFLARIVRTAAMEPEEVEAAEHDLRILYRRLFELHEDGLNGVWTRIIKNQFAPVFIEPCHYIVGNPPWVNWEHLPDEYRLSLIPLYQDVYGLFPHSGMGARHGSSKIDLSSLMTYVAAHRYLRNGAKLGFVLPQGLFKSAGAGQGFRKFVLPDKTPFGPLIVEDMLDLTPFEGATNRTVIAVFAKGHKVRFPVNYSFWEKRTRGRGSGIGFDTPYEEVTKEKITFRKWQAEPVNRSDLTSSWITARPKALQALHRVIGASAYSAHAGSFTGGANAVYWVEIVSERPGGLAIVSNVIEGARRLVPRVQAAVEVELVYPLLRGRDVGRWLATPSISILCPQDPQDQKHAMRQDRLMANYPKVFAYLRRFEEMLTARPAYIKYLQRTGEPFYALYDIKRYTFSPWKVVWREQASSLTAAVVATKDERPIIPDHKLMMVDLSSGQEAHFLCAALNSSPARCAVAAYAVEIGMDTHILENVAVPRFSIRSKIHLRLAKLSEQAHNAAAAGEAAELGRIEDEVDRCSAELWELSDEELAEIKRSVAEM